MKLYIVLIITCLIFACSDNKTTDTTHEESPKTSALLDTQIQSLEKAESVEQSLQEMTDKREEEMRQRGI